MAQEFEPIREARAPKQDQQSALMAQAQQMMRTVREKVPDWSLEEPVSLKELLTRCAYDHDSISELSGSLVSDVHGILRASFQTAGLRISEWKSPEVIAEPSFDKARAQLSSLMTQAKDNLLATITRNDKVEDAVVLIDWQALEVLCSLARKGLQSARKFGDFAPLETFTQEEAEQLARLDIHKPLSGRRSVAQRREVLNAFREELDESDGKRATEDPEEFHGQDLAGL